MRGSVQGVGFRPHVWHLARELGIAGWVRNDGDGVLIHAEGAGEALDRFAARVVAEAPSLATVAALERRRAQPEGHEGFVIAASGPGRVRTGIPADVATCPRCLAELFDPADRRYRHPFINCTQCGPRFTITGALPYDRAQTSMAAFPMCPDCAAEYRDPGNRRFHAQPNACPRCGPRLRLVGADGGETGGDPVAAAWALLEAGAIVAVKGLGGYHLACRADDAGAVARLRARKRRPARPFAVMVLNAASAARWAEVDAAGRRWLEDRRRPIVLLPKAPGCDAELAGVAPGVAWLGAMLPYTPVHYLLFHEAAGRPEGTAWLGRPLPLALVMTSANPGGEPLVIGDEEARERLAGIADAFLVHDRVILVRADDSLLRPEPDGARLLRRGRGWTPEPVPLGAGGPSVLALGAHLKNAPCLTRGEEAFPAQHVGDLDSRAARLALAEAATHLMRVLAVRPEAVVHDLHPDYASTALARRLAAELGVGCWAVQHHHAHVGAVCAEHGAAGPVVGIAADGVGLGTDGAAWGGELLWVHGARWRRLGALVPLPLPGGDAAAREPWRMAAAVLHRLGRGGEIARRFPGPAAEAVAAMLARGVRCPPTTSLGRLFDAAAALLGLCLHSSYEGQAAMALEALARRAVPRPPLPDGFRTTPAGLDLLPLLQWLAGRPARDAEAAAVFHATVAEALARWAAAAAREAGAGTVALGGGCMANALLAAALRARLEAQGLAVLEARAVPAGDGGLALGQAWIVRDALRRGMEPGPVVPEGGFACA
ncbi:carbamoyltransferase HypF [Inmirania thermothiophila]|uniref:carbamoyltransferase HypF n=1 Tax=Inmirania thermothiophila TaxID=1750597 RepID=UPI001FE7B325|nr:carbamoyltransferase HypF [Inmirania thermothiophila]